MNDVSAAARFSDPRGAIDALHRAPEPEVLAPLRGVEDAEQLLETLATFLDTGGSTSIDSAMFLMFVG